MMGREWERGTEMVVGGAEGRGLARYWGKTAMCYIFAPTKFIFHVHAVGRQKMLFFLTPHIKGNVGEGATF